MDQEAGKVVRSSTEKKGANDVVLQIPSASQEPFFVVQESNDSQANIFLKNSQLGSSPRDYSNVVEAKDFETPRLRAQSSSSVTASSPNKLPKVTKIDSVTRRKPYGQSEFSKPKSRLVEPFYGNDSTLKEMKNKVVTSSSPYRRSPNNITASPKGNLKSPPTPITPKTPLIGSPGLENEEEEEEVEDEAVYGSVTLEVTREKGKKWKFFILVEFTAFVCIMGLLIASLTVDRLKNSMIWGLELWKWCVLILVILCGRLVAEWSINVLVFLIERNFLFKKKVLYFVYGVKKSVQAFIWLGLVLLAWGLLFDRGVERSRYTMKVLNYITRALAACLIGAAIWLLKTFLVKLLASSFHVNRFFDRIQESIFHQYILRALSGPPVMEMAEGTGSTSTTPGRLSFRKKRNKNEGMKEEVIDVDKLKKMKHEKVSAWTMKELTNVVRGTSLTTLSSTLDQSDDEEGEQKDKEITSEWEAKAAAYKVFKNVAKPGRKYIEEADLLRFMKKEEVDNMMPLFEGAVETGKIRRSVFKKWLVNVYNERKLLAHSLNDAKTAIEELNKLVSGILLVVIIIVWLLLMGLLTTHVLLFISSQLLLVVFMFGNTAKTVFEALIFVFVMHPFDVGDRCVIDGIQMVVEEMNILTTVFLRYDNEKIFYPNSVLATKPISNYYRSPEMSDAVDFAVDVSTSIETIGVLKARIKVYLESKPQHWRPSYSLQVKEIEDVNKMKMSLFVNHTINFQNIGDRGSRRSDLVLEMKRIFEDLGIKYHLLPQEVHLRYVGSAAQLVPLPTR